MFNRRFRMKWFDQHINNDAHKLALPLSISTFNCFSTLPFISLNFYNLHTHSPHSSSSSSSSSSSLPLRVYYPSTRRRRCSSLNTNTNTTMKTTLSPSHTPRMENNNRTENYPESKTDSTKTQPLQPEQRGPTTFDTICTRSSVDAVWVDTARIHHGLISNHFVDILDVYGPLYRTVHTPDPPPSYASRMRALSGEYRRQALGALSRGIGLENVVAFGHDTAPNGDEIMRVFNGTKSAMMKNIPLIVNPVLVCEKGHVYARPPALIRVDVAKKYLNLNFDEHDKFRKGYVPLAVKRRPVMTERESCRLKRGQMDRLKAEAALWIYMLSSMQNDDEDDITGTDNVAVIGLLNSRKQPVANGALIPTDQADSHLPFDMNIWKAARMNVMSHLPQGFSALEWRIQVVDDGEKWLNDSMIQVEKDQEEEAQNNNEGDTNVESMIKIIDPITALAKVTRNINQRPNMKVADMYDWPWAQCKRRIALTTGELTLVSGISNMTVLEHTKFNNALHIDTPNDFRHQLATGDALKVDRPYTKTCLQMIKPRYNGPDVKPACIEHNRSNWRLLKDYEDAGFLGGGHDDSGTFERNGPKLSDWQQRSFYVDFELASPDVLLSTPGDLAEHKNKHKKYEQLHEVIDVVPSNAPEEEEGDENDKVRKRQEALIFMIGCGRLVNGEWEYKCFGSKSLSLQGEYEVINEWLNYMLGCMQHISSSTTESNSKVDSAYVFVWGPEQQLLKKAVGRMKPNQQSLVKSIVQFHMINMLQVIMKGNLCVRGCLNQSIKHVAQALTDLKLVKSYDGVAQRVLGTVNDEQAVGDANAVMGGMDVMAIALDAVESVRGKHHKQRDNESRHLMDLKGMKQVGAYNEADCLDIARITNYLRNHH